MSRVQLTASQLDRIEDALEGLEGLGADDPLLSGADDESRVVAEHLDAYRQILVLTRDAMPLQDAPMGALDGVIAAAHASVAGEANAAQDVEAVAAAPAKDEQSWWQRLHASVWVPALGFAGAAALLLLVMQPGADEEEVSIVAQHEGDDLRRRADEAAGAAALEPTNAPASEAPARKTLQEGRLADSLAAKDGEGEEDLRGAGVERRPRVRERNEDGVDPFAAADETIGGAARSSKSDKSDMSDEDADLPGIALGGATAGKSNAGKASGQSPAPPPPPKPAPNAAPKKKAKSTTKSGGSPSSVPGTTKVPAGPPAEPAPEPEPVAPAELDDEDKHKTNGSKGVGEPKEEPAADDLFLLQRGEKARKLGKCGSAKLDFNKAKASPDGKIRARALAGLGLCALSAGNDGTAESLFSQARKASGSVENFISRERALIEGPHPQAQQQTKD